MTCSLCKLLFIPHLTRAISAANFAPDEKKISDKLENVMNEDF